MMRSISSWAQPARIPSIQVSSRTAQLIPIYSLLSAAGMIARSSVTNRWSTLANSISTLRRRSPISRTSVRRLPTSPSRSVNRVFISARGSPIRLFKSSFRSLTRPVHYSCVLVLPWSILQSLYGPNSYVLAARIREEVHTVWGPHAGRAKPVSGRLDSHSWTSCSIHRTARLPTCSRPRCYGRCGSGGARAGPVRCICMVSALRFSEAGVCCGVRGCFCVIRSVWPTPSAGPAGSLRRLRPRTPRRSSVCSVHGLEAAACVHLDDVLGGPGHPALTAPTVLCSSTRHALRPDRQVKPKGTAPNDALGAATARAPVDIAVAAGSARARVAGRAVAERADGIGGYSRRTGEAEGGRIRSAYSRSTNRFSSWRRTVRIVERDPATDVRRCAQGAQAPPHARGCQPRSLRRRRFAARNGSPAHDLSHVSGRLRRSAGRGGFSVVGEQMTKFGPRGPHGRQRPRCASICRRCEPHIPPSTPPSAAAGV